MRKYKKKPIVVDVEQFIVTDKSVGQIADDYEFCELKIRVIKGEHKPELKFFIETLEGEMETKPGDYIIKGIKGEFYFCKKDIFEETYEEVNKEKK